MNLDVLLENSSFDQYPVEVRKDAMNEVGRIVSRMRDFINDIRNFESRKEQADAITRSQGSTVRASMLFTLLDSEELTEDDYTELFRQVLENE